LNTTDAANPATSVTVRQATFDLLRALDLTTVFGNPGSTELPFLHDWPTDFRYVLALQEASAVAMADGFAQATRRAAFVNLHSAAGLGNALGNVFTAFRNQTPLVITAGQQVRALLLQEPYLFAESATEFPKPYVKWSCEPARPQDVPAALARAYHIATQPPCGPTFVSIPVDDWEVATDPVRVRTVRRQTASDPAQLRDVVEAIDASVRPAFVVGPEVDRADAGAWALAVQLAEKVRAAVWVSPVSSRCSFPEDHPLFSGFLPAAPASLSAMLSGYDLVVVLGAPVFTFHVDGDCPLFCSGVPIFQLTEDPTSAARATIGNSIVGTMRPMLEALLAGASPAPHTRHTPLERSRVEPPSGGDPISPEFVMHMLAEAMPRDAVIVEEAPSHRAAMQRHLPIRTSGGFYNMASGGLGWGLPAAVGVALAEPTRRVICVIGDGSTMYSVQAWWTAAQLQLPLTTVVLNNAGYGAMRAFSQMMKLGDVPGIDLPGLDFVALAMGQGCDAVRVTHAHELAGALGAALHAPGPSVVEIGVEDTVADLYAGDRR
jgi:benzoylformate decarboxylase